MKKSIMVFSLTLILCCISTSYVMSQTKSYVQLYPGDNKKIIFQILPDQNYSDVNAYIQLCSTDGTVKKIVVYEVTNEEDKYILKDVCTSRIFSHNVRNIAYAKLDHVTQNETRGKADDAKKGLSIPSQSSTDALEKIPTKGTNKRYSKASYLYTPGSVK